MLTESPRIAVVGSGYWGKNLVRNFHELRVLECVCDTRPEALDQARTTYGVKTATDLAHVLTDPAVTGVAIASPAALHFQLARRCLEAGKDVFVEKPLALHAAEGRELAALALCHGRILMVGHILHYHPAIVALRQLIRDGELGSIRYIYSSRLNLGKLRTEENILWSFAPHDISAILHLLDEMPTAVTSQGGRYVNSEIFDTSLTTCRFASGAQAHIFVSWLHPFKEQKLVVVGGRKMAVFNDMEPDNKLVLYHHRIEWPDRVPVARAEAAEVVPLPKAEPLRVECAQFLECMQTRRQPSTNAEEGIRVLQVLEASERSLRQGGAPVDVVSETCNYFAHPTAVIDEGARIGAGTKIWHFSHIMSGAVLGERCNLGQNVVISPDVVIGKNVKIQNNVSVYTGVVLEDDVFCGPSMVFTNVINPRSHVVRRDEYRHTIVRRGASIGANATVVCGITIGEYAFIGAGAVVTRDVPDYALMVGTPARRTGWMCACGVRLPQGVEPACSACGARYTVADATCRRVEGSAAHTAA